MVFFIILNVIVFFLCLCIFAACGGFGKVFWTLVFAGFTYFNVNVMYPNSLEIERQERIAQEKLRNCDVLRPNDRVVVYHCPEYTTTVNSIRVGKSVRTETITINNK